MTEFLPTSTETIRWGVRPHRGEADAAFVRELADRDLTAPPRRRETLKIIEVNDESAGIIVLRKTKVAVHVVDLRLVERWQWRGIEKEIVERLAEWANENSLVLKRPGGLDFPDSAPVGKLIKESVALWKARKKEKAWIPSGRTWLISLFSLAVLYFVFRWTGLFTPTTIHSSLRHIRPEAIRIRMTILVVLVLAAATPVLLSEVRGRLAGGAVLLDLGSRGRRWWSFAALSLFAAATACFLFGGWSLDTGGAMGLSLILPAVVTALLALRRGQIREGGFLRPGLPGFIPRNAIAGWSREKWGPALILSRYVPGHLVNRVRLPDRPDVLKHFGEPTDSPGTAMPNLFLSIMVFLLLTQGVEGYFDDIPKERPPGVVGFAMAEDTVLTIGEETRIRIFPFVHNERTGMWEEIEPKCIDLSLEKIEIVLQALDADGRPVTSTAKTTGYG